MKETNKGLLNTREQNKKIFILVIAILIVMFLSYLILNVVENKNKTTKSDINNIIKQQESAVLYVWNSNSKKCKDCKKIKEHLDKKKIVYYDYDVKNYSKSEYEKFLTKLSINPPDFNYPAVIYMKNGALYSNIININDTKTVDTFIKEYQLKDVK